MTKQEVLIQLLVSINQGNAWYVDSAVSKAYLQLTQLEQLGCKFDENEE